ncbi:MAG: hypothetical protein K6F66_01815 [Pseudobutyrivibrio sp.]|nr:hypothetical protein [Pseudobutyrivibrio sp.]
MKKKLALLLATIATVATVFTGCGEKDISGDYKASMNISEFMEDTDLSDAEQLGIDMSSLTVDVTLNLTEENEFTLAFDPESFKDQFKTLITDNMDSIIDSALESEGMTRADFTDEMAQLVGYDSADEFFTALSDELMTELDSEFESLDDELAEYQVTGSYKVSKNSVLFTASDDESDELLVDNGVINEDGSLTITTEDEDGTEYTLDFTAVSAE